KPGKSAGRVVLALFCLKFCHLAAPFPGRVSKALLSVSLTWICPHRWSRSEQSFLPYAAEDSVCQKLHGAHLLPCGRKHSDRERPPQPVLSPVSRKISLIRPYPARLLAVKKRPFSLLPLSQARSEEHTSEL